jgi:two-component sensor histidine kinase
VAFREAPNEPPTLTVADEGEVPPDFDPTKSRGLGMRIVTGLLRGRGGRFEVDQNQSYTCVRAVFTQAQAE